MNMSSHKVSQFSDAEYACRYGQIHKLLEERQLSALLCYGNRGAPGMLHYLANVMPRWETYLVVTPGEEPVLFVQLYNHVPNARRISNVKDVRWGESDSIQTVVDELKSKGLVHERVGLSGALPYQRYAALRRLLPGAEWQDMSTDLTRLRWVKSDEEIERMKEAARLTDLALSALEKGAHAGLRETDLAGLMQAAVQPLGGQLELCYLASTPMRAPEVCVPAQDLSERVLRKGDVIITEIGVSWRGYAGQIHRPISVGEAPSTAYRELFDLALEAYLRIAEVIRPGASEQDVLNAADIIEKRGFTIYDDLVHGFGGGYLPPILRTRRTTHGKVESFVFQKNMCIVIQPNVITPDERMGLQLGQLHLVTDDGLAPLQHYPLKFIIAAD
ncbi:MAG: Xaa-Pro peptidase family protein [Anaerolineales bacterium]|jgi:Xaa-Pro dipeptidase